MKKFIAYRKLFNYIFSLSIIKQLKFKYFIAPNFRKLCFVWSSFFWNVKNCHNFFKLWSIWFFLQTSSKSL